jgi:hypothetical protein
MRKNNGSLGEGKLGLFIAIIVVAAVIFAGSKFVPVYVASYDMKDTLRREVQGASLKKDKAIVATILEKAKELKLPIGPKNIEATRTNAKFTLRIHFTQDLDLALFVYTFRFDEKQSAPLF